MVDENTSRQICSPISFDPPRAPYHRMITMCDRDLSTRSDSICPSLEPKEHEEVLCSGDVDPGRDRNDDDVPPLCDRESFTKKSQGPVESSSSSSRQTGGGKKRKKRDGASSSRRSSAKRTFVDHSYHDHLHDPRGMEPPSLPNSRKGPRGGVTVPFPDKLHAMLTVTEKEGSRDIVSWQPHGRCFRIHKTKEFVENVMPRFFQQSKLTSFQRQLNLYGFLRITAGRDQGSYYHELFLRGRKDLTLRLMRTKVKGNGVKAAASPSTEPDFYAMEHCHADGCCVDSSGVNSSRGDSSDGDSSDDSDAIQMELRVTRENSNNPLEAKSEFPLIDDQAFLPIAPEDVMDIMEDDPFSSKSDGVVPMNARASSAPTLISPPSSPVHTDSVSSSSSSEIPDGCCHATTETGPSRAGGSARPMTVPSPCARKGNAPPATAAPMSPNSGDVVFFEGLSFRFVEHRDLEEVLVAFAEHSHPLACI